MILLLAGPSDDHADSVQTELERRGAPVARLDPDSFSGIGAVSLALASAGRLDGVVRSNGGEVHVEDIRAVWISGHGRFAANPVLDDLWDALDVPVIPGSSGDVERASHEIRQLREASELGFEIPGTLVTDDDSRLHSVQTEVNEVAHLRVTVVGDRSFAFAFTGGAAHPHISDWWRYDDAATTATSYVLPAAEAERCRQLVHSLGLEYAALDFAITEENKIVFLRLDPHGHFRWMEGTGLPVTRALVRLLIERAAEVDPFPTANHPSALRWSPRKFISNHPAFVSSKKVTPAI